MTREEIAALAQGMVPFVREVMDEKVASLEKRLGGKPVENGGNVMSLQDAFDKGFEAVKAYVDAEFGDIKKQIAALEAAQKDMLSDGDVWREATLYRRGAVVTHDGTIWVAKEANSRARPGQSNAWRLMQKTKGR